MGKDLPHLEKTGGSYFVTVCLSGLERRRVRLEGLDVENIGRASEPIPGTGSLSLTEARVGKMVEESLLHFQGERYLLSAWCVMPDHLHAVLTPLGEWTLAKIMHGWKSFTAHEINLRLGREGSVWQRETFDHLIRSADDFARFVRYVERNPVEAGLCDHPGEWPLSSARFAEDGD
jgi:REP element-mobilizing transposase RayT